ncbi:MAG: hypothetical protein K5799_07560 [Erythrobacter sp.]|nr:hypothetical protein [Erythrobacter sp.]
MKIIVPLAGPDFETEGGQVKAMTLLDGEPLLRKVLTSRPWFHVEAGNDRACCSSEDLVFVLRNSPPSVSFASGVLCDWFPGCRTVMLGDYARGAACSALSALSLCSAPGETICIDLADIAYRTSLQPDQSFSDCPSLGGIALTFHSDNPAYSYLETDASGKVLRAREKEVISQNASAGTYFFRNVATYLLALAHSMRHEEELAYNGLFFVCPLMNGIIENGERVMLEQVSDVRDIKVFA